MSYREENEKLIPRLKRADIVRIERDKGYFHFALYIGDMMAIHLVGPSHICGISSGGLSSGSMAAATCLQCTFGEVKKELLLEIAGKDLISIANINEPFDDESEVIKRAEAQIGVHHYNLLKYNCEHFVNHMKYNLKRSMQVENIKRNPSIHITGIVLASSNTLSDVSNQI
ncbi:phospholipase A and acyltransferase 3-like [Physella acuta]|uniref:phospholipase A and acyltransferase 3-like n=1 Tax=Physella acuta TaxID=109671 RepID=UPI0027DD7182|nr:phospholipase A and acyltransferase 3-like [Physella acuta]